MTAKKPGRPRLAAKADKPLKSTVIEVEARVSTVLSLLVAGCTRREIIRYAAEKTTWGVCERQIENYIAAANRAFEELSKTSRAREIGRALARLDDLYAKSLRIQDYKGCLATQKEINDLLALYAPRVDAAPEGVDNVIISGGRPSNG